MSGLTYNTDNLRFSAPEALYDQVVFDSGNTFPVGRDEKDCVRVWNETRYVRGAGATVKTTRMGVMMVGNVEIDVIIMSQLPVRVLLGPEALRKQGLLFVTGDEEQVRDGGKVRGALMKEGVAEAWVIAHLDLWVLACVQDKYAHKREEPNEPWHPLALGQRLPADDEYGLTEAYSAVVLAQFNDAVMDYIAQLEEAKNQDMPEGAAALLSVRSDYHEALGHICDKEVIAAVKARLLPEKALVRGEQSPCLKCQEAKAT